MFAPQFVFTLKLRTSRQPIRMPAEGGNTAAEEFVPPEEVPTGLRVNPFEPEDRTTFVLVSTLPPTVSRDVLETEITINTGAPSTPLDW
jgi:hypothetical protein